MKLTSLLPLLDAMDKPIHSINPRFASDERILPNLFDLPSELDHPYVGDFARILKGSRERLGVGGAVCTLGGLACYLDIKTGTLSHIIVQGNPFKISPTVLFLAQESYHGDDVRVVVDYCGYLKVFSPSGALLPVTYRELSGDQTPVWWGEFVVELLWA